jgi:hypothetical protein
MAKKEKNGDNYAKVHGLRKKSDSRERAKEWVERLDREKKIKNPRQKARSSMNQDLRKVIKGDLDFDDFTEEHGVT